MTKIFTFLYYIARSYTFWHITQICKLHAIFQFQLLLIDLIEKFTFCFIKTKNMEAEFKNKIRTFEAVFDRKIRTSRLDFRKCSYKINGVYSGRFGRPPCPWSKSQNIRRGESQ